MSFRIINPLPGGSEFTTDKQAARMIRAGLAKLVGRNLIKFKQSHQKESVGQSLRQATAQEYDRAGKGVSGAFAAHLAKIPVVNPAKMIRQEASPRDWSYSKAVLRRSSAPTTGNGTQREMSLSR